MVFKKKPLKKVAQLNKLQRENKATKRKIKIRKQMQKNTSRVYSA